MEANCEKVHAGESQEAIFVGRGNKKTHSEAIALD
jgi:hypothetical protein